MKFTEMMLNELRKKSPTPITLEFFDSKRRLWSVKFNPNSLERDISIMMGDNLRKKLLYSSVINLYLMTGECAVELALNDIVIHAERNG